MKRLFVFEYLTAGGAADLGAAAASLLLPQGQAMRDAMVQDLLDDGGFQVSVAGCALAPPPPAGALPCFAPPGMTLFDWVSQQAARHDAVWLVAPETDGLLTQFHAAATRNAQHANLARWLGCDAASIALASRKRGTLARLAAMGLKTPLLFTSTHTPARWVVKPDDGAGAVDTRVFDSLAAAHAAQCEGESRCSAADSRPSSLTLEPWVDGEALSLSLLCSVNGAELLSINRQHIHVAADGQVHYAGVSACAMPLDDARAPALAHVARRVFDALPGLRGFVGVDLVWHAGLGPVVIEVNPRLTCAYVGLSAKLQRNLAAEIAGSPGHLLPARSAYAHAHA